MAHSLALHGLKLSVLRRWAIGDPAGFQSALRMARV
jgi:hypothetical protein